MTGSKTLVVAQTGGPSAVINSTLAGIIEEARLWPQIDQVIGCINGFHGLFGFNCVKLSEMTDDQLVMLRNTPGAFLGSSRMHLTEQHLSKVPDLLTDLQAGYYLQIGGNGTMYAAGVIDQVVKEAGYPIQVIGVPKTVDNDIVGMDHTPGYASAAKYVAQATLDIGIDLWSMRHFEQVRVVEVMGRNVGWLAAAAALAKSNKNEAPHLIYLPELPFDEEQFIDEVHDVVQKEGYAVAVIGEGIKDKHNNCIGSMPFADVKQGSQVYGGASFYLANRISEVLKIRARAQDLGIAQRCFGAVRSEIDEQEAYMIGRAAVKAAAAEMGGSMVDIFDMHDALRFSTVPLLDVGGREKKVPENFYNKQTKQVTEEFVSWLKPLIGEWNPKYLRLEHLD